MNAITRNDLIAFGGASNALYAVFYPDGSLYFCTTAEAACRDEDYWRGQGLEIKQVMEET